MAKLTVKQIESLKAKNTPYKRKVDTGLLVRVAANGVKTWIVQYVPKGGKQRDYRLPRPFGDKTDEGHLSLADACAEKEAIRALARNGIDFQIQQEQARYAEAQARAEKEAADAAKLAKDVAESKTVKDMFDTWISDGVSRKDGNTELLRSFAADVLPRIGNKKVKDLTENDLRGVLRKMVGRGVNRSAVVMRNNLVQMFAWAEKRQPWRKLLSECNPAELIEIERIVSREYDINAERDRTLSSEEICELRDIMDRMRAEYDAASDKRSTSRPLARTTELGIWIMLSTMCRVGEMSMSRWEHVDFEAGTWFIPKANVKDNIDDLTVFMSDFTQHQFRQLKEVTGDSDWCFPARNKDDEHVCTKSMSKQIGDRQTMFKKAKDGSERKPMVKRRHDNTLVLSNGKNGAWTPHDLRRTGSTLMQSLGVPLDIIDRCQNHVLSGSKVRRAYLQHDYAEEKREAWRWLGDRLNLILQPANNVVMLKNRKPPRRQKRT